MDEIRVHSRPSAVPRNPMNPTRRNFLADTGMGFTGMALSAMLFRNGEAQASAAVDGESGGHFPGRAKSCIWIFNIGGVSHMESFDPKPTLSKYDGKTIDDTPLAALTDEDRVNSNLLRSSAKHREIYKKIKGLQTGFKPYGQNSTLVSDWFPNIGGVIVIGCGLGLIAYGLFCFASHRFRRLDDHDHG